MFLKTFQTGPLNVNTYLLIDEVSNEALIIDLGGDYKKIKTEIENNNAKLAFILNTHAHFDHILGENEAQKIDDVKILMSKNDNALIDALSAQISMWGMGLNAKSPVITEFIDEHSKLYLGNNKIDVIETPGHSKGGLSFFIDDKLFVGDTLFREEIGRTDLPTGNYDELIFSIKNKLLKYPDNTKVFCGHGEPTTIGHEKQFNPYVK